MKSISREEFSLRVRQLTHVEIARIAGAGANEEQGGAGDGSAVPSRGVEPPPPPPPRVRVATIGIRG